MNDVTRLIELRWQKDVIERWLSLPVSRESKTQLEELLSTTNRELTEIETKLIEAELKTDDKFPTRAKAS